MADPTIEDQMLKLAIATGGNNQFTDINSPAAKSAFASAINAQARRILGERAGQSAVMQQREQQWLRGERSAADGFATEAEKKWVEANPKLIGSQRPTELPGGVTRSVLPDGYTVLTDAQGKIIGTNRPLDSVVPYAGETKDQARAAINQGQATEADRARLGEALRQSIYQTSKPATAPASAAPSSTLGPYTQGAPETFMDRALRTMGTETPPSGTPYTQEAFLDRLSRSLGPSFASAATTATPPTPATPPAPSAAAAPAAAIPTGGDVEKLGQMEAIYAGKMAPSEEEMRISEQRKDLLKQLEGLRELRDRGRPTSFLSMASGRMPASLATQTREPLSGKEKGQVAEQIAALEKLLGESVSKEAEVGAKLRPDQAFMEELLRLRAAREGSVSASQAPTASAGQSPLTDAQILDNFAKYLQSTPSAGASPIPQAVALPVTPEPRGAMRAAQIGADDGSAVAAAILGNLKALLNKPARR